MTAEPEILHNAPPMALFRNGPVNAAGHLDVERGRGLLARIGAVIGGMPKAGPAVPLTLQVTRTANGFLWKRSFAGRPFNSVLVERDGLLEESFGLMRVAFRLVDVGDNAEWQVQGMRLGPIPIPRFLRFRAFTRPTDKGWFVDVGVSAPLVGLLCRWHGNVEVV